MNSGWRRMRGAVGMGLTWAVVWAPIAVVIGTQIIDPTNKMDEMWWMVGAMPGFISGVVFSVVLSTAARRRRLEELSVTRVGVWGALAGLITGIIPFLIGDRGGEPMLPLAVVVIPTFTVVSALSAAASLALAQLSQKRESLAGDASSRHFGLPNDVPPSINAGMPNRTTDSAKSSVATHEPPVR